eukprot:TRINITY_DN8373_c0_g1_i5.p1 TRINITY_DN8373_c0_g1~~TRINITY_DN8373_c0_g1_i5.p1  ORF type:complete len:454 (+),score=64.75 TRINITY_DN8373_c0_g1_i5:104-1465(+)
MDETKDLDGLLESSSNTLQLVYRRLHDLEEAVRQLANENVQLRQRLGDDSAFESLPVDTNQDPKNRKIARGIQRAYQAGTKLASTLTRTDGFSHEAVVVTRYNGHNDGVWDCKTLINDQLSKGLVFSACADRCVRVFDAPSGACMLTYREHKGAVNAVDVLAQDNGRREVSVLTGSGDATIHLWQLPGELYTQRTLTASNLPQDEAAPIQPNVSIAPATIFRGHSAPVASVAFAGGSRVVSGSWDRSAVLWDVKTAQSVLKIDDNDNGVTHVAWNEARQLASICCKEPKTKLFDFRQDHKISKVSVIQGHRASVNVSCFYGDHCLATGSDDSTIKLWDLRVLKTPLDTINTGSGVNRMAISPNEKLIAAPLDSRHVKIYTLAGSKHARLPSRRRQGHRRIATAVAWLDNEHLLSSSFDSNVYQWRLFQSEQPRRLATLTRRRQESQHTEQHGD